MSASGLNYMMRSLLGSSKRLAAYYDFASFNGEVDPESTGPYTGVFYNQFPAYDTGKYTIDVLSATGASEAAALNLLTGAASGVARLSESNLRIPRQQLQANNMSAIIDFEWNGEVENGVILGSFDVFEETLGSETVTGSRGWNFGVDDRGGLFFHSFLPSGQAIFTATGIELSKRNILGLSISKDEVSFAQFDYFNDEVYEESTFVSRQHLANPDYFYVGGSTNFLNTTDPAIKTLSGSIHEIALFSGFIPQGTLKDIGSGILGDYYHNTGIQTTEEVVTGYLESISYQTGITGVTLQEAGTLNVSTGRHYYTGLFTGTSEVSSNNEGDDTYVFYNFDNGEFKTTYKEKIGYLDADNNFQYSPTGENAFDTLGLQTGSFTVSGDIDLTLDAALKTGSYKIYQRVEQTGVLYELSGVTRTPLTETVTRTGPASSGIVFDVDSTDLKKDYIYYKGQRL